MLTPDIDYKAFYYKDIIYYYFRGNGLICKVYDDIKTYDLNKSFFPNKYEVINDKNKDFQEINDALLKSDLVRRLPVRSRKKTVKISLLVAQECNLKCSYCYGAHGTYHDNGLMSVKTAINTIDTIVLMSKAKKINICFFGGEPLLNFDLIKKVVLYCEKQQEITGQTFGFDIISNGILLNEEIDFFIFEHNIQLQISLDGSKLQNDRYRIDSDGRGSYDKVIQKTAWLRKKGVLSVRATLMPDNMDFSTVYKHLFSLNFRNIYISPAFNYFNNGEAYEGLTEQYLVWLNQMENSIKKCDYKFVSANANLINILSKIDKVYVRNTFCGAADNLIAVNIHGKMFPCHRFVNFDKFGVESIEKLDKENQKMLQKIRNERSEDCLNCWALNLCNSGCIYNNYMEGGMFTSTNPCYCRYFKNILEKIIYIYIKIKEDTHIITERGIK